MQYKVPQNIDVEDKVIAGLTLRQFLFLAVSGGIVVLVYVFFNTLGLGFLIMPTCLFVGLIGAALAFIKINERPMELFLASAITTLVKPTKRMWKKEVENIAVPKEEIVTTSEVKPKKQSLGEIKSNLQRLATVVDSGGVNDLEEGRITNVKPAEINDPAKVQDILKDTEESSERLNKYIKNAAKTVNETKKEKPISSLATVATTPEDFKYENLQLKNEKNLDELLEKVEEEQKAKEESIETATIKKFDRKN